MEDEELMWDMEGREEIRASQMININMRMATNEICLPMEDTKFHEMKASG
jgi:hypothetical protein